MASPSSSLCSSLASPRAASLGHRHRLAFSSPRKAFQVKASARVDKYSKNDIIVSPSILSANFAKLGDQVKVVEVAGCDWIHVDVMDGRFVPNITIGPLVVDALRLVTDLPLDAHLMIVEPEQRVPDFINYITKMIMVTVYALLATAAALQMDPKFLKNLRYSRKHNKKSGEAEAEE